MSVNDIERSNRGPGVSTNGLESHLRNLILSNNTPGQDRTSKGVPPVQSALQPSPSLVAADSDRLKQNDNHRDESSIDPPGRQNSQQNKTSRKRPNQAQRRQMSSQLAISIDPRPQEASPKNSYVNPSGHPARASPPAYQRHMHSNSHPRTVPPGTRSHNSHPSGQWNRGSQFHGGSSPNNGQFQHRHQRDPSSVNPDQMSPQARNGTGFVPHNRKPLHFRPEEVLAQATLLEQACFNVVTNSEIQLSEIAEKEAFRCRIEAITREAIAKYEQEELQTPSFPPQSVELRCFGSLSSGFATKASDMDLGLLSPLSRTQPDAPGSEIPRILEKALLDAGLGARLLTRTRVPIIKLCENPPEKLQQGLLEERYKWENGIENEAHEGHDDEEHEHAIVPNDHVDDHSKAVAAADDESPSATDFTVPNPDTGEVQRFRLKQGPKNSLLSYYGLAKRVLRKAGGRDVTISNQQEFSDKDWNILHRVCEAFVAGLADSRFRDSLAIYPSLNFPSNSNLPAKISLLGVFTLVEGEQLLQVWRDTKVEERNQGQHHQALHTIQIWEGCRARPSIEIDDPGFYTKELQMVLERFKKFPSVQFISLEQGQYETPTVYYSRTSSFINQVKQPEEVSAFEWQTFTVEQYVRGIFQPDIRDQISQGNVGLEVEILPLASVARRHKTLHLAWEFERALDKELYEQSSVEDVKNYITLLRSSDSHLPASGSRGDYVIPITPANGPLISRIKKLPYPHNLAPNQPRDRYRDRLEFPKTGAGVQCDINFSAHLALQNTLLLRCYSHSDARVRPMVLFIKHWAKVRGINSGYRGTLSSYGYVLMVLHYLVNVAQPFVCPNLQALAPPPPPNPSPAEIENTLVCNGYNVQFWRNEHEILRLAHANQLNSNADSLGHLLRGFFEYYAQTGMMSSSNGKGFDWGRDVLSLRTPCGLLPKQAKGWTGAKTVMEVQGHTVDSATAQGPATKEASTAGSDGQAKAIAAATKSGEVKEVRHRYLFAIEDPFELDHNVARTVTHNGIVSIRDEFRRAWRIIKSAGHGPLKEDLLRDVNDVDENASPFLRLLEDIHGPLTT